jgi:N-acetylglucosamine-6-sulfatase
MAAKITPRQLEILSGFARFRAVPRLCGLTGGFLLGKALLLLLLLGLAAPFAACNLGDHDVCADGAAVRGSAPSTSANPIPGRGRPNIIVITTDDQEYDTLDVMPNVQRLIEARGVRFTNSFVEFSFCCPSRAAFLTGKLAHNHHILGNDTETDGSYGRYRKLWEGDDLPVWLQQAGYVTAVMGRWLNGYGDTSLARDVPAGWNEWFVPSRDPQGKFGGIFNRNGGLVKYTDTIPRTDILADRAVAFINAQAKAGHPFFLWITPTEPHVPLDVAPEYAGTMANCQLYRGPDFNEADVSDKPLAVQARPLLDSAQIEYLRRDRCRTLEMLQSVDKLVERVIAALERTGQLANTYVFYTTDNGYLFGSHRIEWQKTWPYERSIRVPLVARGPDIPDTQQLGQTRDGLVLNIDLTATILDIAGVAKQVDGRSLLSLVADPDVPWRTDILLTGRGGDNGPRPLWNAIRTARWKYVEHETGSKELYDIQDDPHELNSRHAASGLYACVRDVLAARLAAINACRGENCFVSLPAPETACSHVARKSLVVPSEGAISSEEVQLSGP